MLDGVFGTFNRTSMESKLINMRMKRGNEKLLIEPVWNRNKRDDPECGVIVCLLIEPVWNRNFVDVALKGYTLDTF